MKKQLHLIWLIAILTVHIPFSFAQRSNCSAYPEPMWTQQPDGSRVELRMEGNEGFFYYRTSDGYAVLQNPNNGGAYEIAIQDASGNLVPSGILAGSHRGKQLPAPGLTPSKKQQLAGWKALTRNMPPAAFHKQSDQLFPSIGRRKVLVVLMQFPDEKAIYPKENFERLLSQPGYNENGCTGSFRDYYLENSHGKLDLDVTVLGWYTAAKNRVNYGRTTAQGADNPNYSSNLQDLIAQAIDSAEAAGIDWQDYDNDQDGEMDGLVVFHSGFGAEQQKNGYIWSHRSSLWGDTRRYDGVDISNYCINPAKRDFNSTTTQVRIGVITHEFGHILGLPDLYDPEYNSRGAGNWCLMAGGPWMNDERTPCRLNAWCKMEMGWLTPTILPATGSFNLINSSDSNMAYRMNSQLSNEYFLLENRQQKKWDRFLPGRGLAIWHINTDKADNYRLFGMNDVNTDTAMFGVGLVQADGLRELERDIDSGDEGDLYPGSRNNTSFTGNSIPASLLHQTSNGRRIKSIVNITNIVSNPDSSISFNVGVRASASFLTSALQGCVPFLVNFTNTSSNGESYQWLFGNGEISNNASPSYTFSQAGTFTTKLIVYDAAGTPVDTSSVSINVFEKPKASFTIERPNDSLVKFTNTSTGATEYVWRFSDGRSALAPSFNLTVKNPIGFYLLATNAAGCSDTAYGNLWNNSLSDVNAPSIAVKAYPNPIKDHVQLEFEMPESGPLTVSVYNILGELVAQREEVNINAGKNAFTLPQSWFESKGMYVIQLQTATAKGTVRLMKP